MTPNHPIPPERIRAEAERVVNEFAALKSYNALWRMHHPDNQARFIECVAAGVSLVDVSAVQREAARKAIEALCEFRAAVETHALMVDGYQGLQHGAAGSNAQIRAFLDPYLAVTYPAPAPRECVLSWGVMAQYKHGQWCVWSSWPVDRGTSPLAVADSPWHHVRCFADAEAIKQFAERAK